MISITTIWSEVFGRHFQTGSGDWHRKGLSVQAVVYVAPGLSKVCRVGWELVCMSLVFKVEELCEF